MRVLFTAAGSAATVFALTPLATALRNAGHEVVMAANDAMVPSITGVGLPAVGLTSVPLWDFITKDRAGNPVELPSDVDEGRRYTGTWFARMAAAQLKPALEFARHWRPDVVVGGTMSYVAPLVAATLGVPFVRHAWDAIDARGAHPGADEELRPELRALGLERVPEPDLFVDVCPPGLRPADAGPARLIRWIPRNTQQELRPWMYARGQRPRVCVTAGSRATRDGVDQGLGFLRSMIAGLGPLGYDLLVAAPEPVAEVLRAEFPGIRAGWLPLDVVAPTLDLLVHHAGGATTMAALVNGVPQLQLPSGTFSVMGATAIADFGAGAVLDPAEAGGEIVAKTCRQLLEDPSYRKRARVLADEIASLASPAEVATDVEALVH